MTVLQKYLYAIENARVIAATTNAPIPRFVAISEHDLHAFIECLHDASFVHRGGFNRKRIRKSIEDGSFILSGLRVIIKERVVA